MDRFRPDIEKNYKKYLVFTIIFGIIIKVILMGLFSSDYQDMMFRPFINSFLSGNNPYQYYYDNNLLYSFPYPPVMLFVSCIGGLLTGAFKAAPVFVLNFLFKVPLLLMDLLGLFFLMKILVGKRKYILALYFFSPIILYASYMHGQLDIVPTVFLLGAIYYLTKSVDKTSEEVRAEILFTVFLTLSLCSKFHIAAVLPLIFFYLYQKKGVRKACILTVVPVLATALLIIPFWGEGFSSMVLFNKEQSGIQNVFIDYGSAKLLLSLLIVLFVYYQAYRLNQMNSDLLFSLSGLLFSAFLALVPSMPGWYIWVVPFIMLYFAGLKEMRGKMVLVYALFNFLYLIYYMFFHITEYADLYFLGRDLSWIKIEDSSAKNIVFTLMLGVFFVIIVSMYSYGVNSNSYYRRHNRPFLIGIAGDSGAGKSRLLLMLNELLSSEHILAIEGDGDHKWERGNENWKEMTHLNPRANYLYRQAEDLKTLRDGNAVRRSDYDHETGTFTGKRRLAPKPYVIMSGLHTLYLPQMRQQLDLKVYVDTDEKLRTYWKLRRDTLEREQSVSEVIGKIEERKPDAVKYIYPQKQYADLVIRYFDNGLQDVSPESFDKYESTMGVEFTIDVSINGEAFMGVLANHGINGSLFYDEDLMHQHLIFDHDSLCIDKKEWKEISSDAIHKIEDLTLGKNDWEDGVGGLVQLVLLLCIAETMHKPER